MIQIYFDMDRNGFQGYGRPQITALKMLFDRCHCIIPRHRIVLVGFIEEPLAV